MNQDNFLWGLQITDGLTEDDYIAYPEDSITEGEKVTKNIEDLHGNSDDGSDGSMDDGVDSDVMNGSDDGEIIGGSDEDVMPEEAGSASDMINSADDNMPDEEDYPDDSADDSAGSMPDGAAETGDRPASAE